MAHCVPLPDPGPPNTKITETDGGEKVGVDLWGAERRGEDGGDAMAGIVTAFFFGHLFRGHGGTARLLWAVWVCAGFHHQDIRC